MMPLFPFTVPVLWNGMPMLVVVVPPVFSNVPALLNATATPPPKAIVLSFAKFQTPLVAVLLTIAPFWRFIPPAVPDQVVVPLLFSVRKAKTGLAEFLKLIPAFALVVALAADKQLVAFIDEHIAPLLQFKGVLKFKTPGAAPPMMPAVKFTVEVEIVSVPDPKSIAAPPKTTVPVPLIGPL